MGLCTDVMRPDFQTVRLEGGERHDLLASFAADGNRWA